MNAGSRAGRSHFFTALALIACIGMQSSAGQWSVTPNGEWSSIVRLELQLDDNKRSKSCTGAYIARNLILTAAHCLSSTDEKPDYDKGKVIIHRIGSATAPNQVDFRAEYFLDLKKVREWNSHCTPSCDWKRVPDVALLRMGNNANSSEEFEYLSLRRILRSSQWVGPIILLGYGDHAAQGSPGKLLWHARLQLRLWRDAESTYQVCPKVSENLLLLPGDSGGPVLGKIGNTWYILGVNSSYSIANHVAKNCFADVTKGQVAQWLGEKATAAGNPPI